MFSIIRLKISPQMLAAFSTTLILMFSGFHMGWSSPSLPKILADTSVPVTLTQSTWIVSLLTMGCLFGPIISAAIVDRWGRKMAVLLTTIPLTVASLFMAFAQSYWWYYIGRFIMGIGAGANWSICPMYLGEIVDDNMRGSFGILITVMLNLGYLLCYSIGPWISCRMLIIAGMFILGIHFFTFIWMPETPYFYHMKNEPDNARKSLQWLRGTKNVDDENERVKKSVEFDMKNSTNFKELITDRGNRKALIIVLGLFTIQQLSGVIPIVSYSTTIFNTVGFGIPSNISVIITGIVQLVMSVAVCFYIDNVNRRPLLIASTFTSAIFLTSVGVFFQLQSNGTEISEISWLPVVGVVGYLCVYTIGIGVLPMSLISELFPCNVKAYATMTGTIYLSLSSTSVVQIYPMIVSSFGTHVAFYLFAVITIFSIIFIYFCVPETKGKSLSEIQDILHGRSKPEKALTNALPTSDGTPAIFLSSVYTIPTNDQPKSPIM